MFRVHGDPDTYRYSPASPDPDFAASEETLGKWLEQWQDEGYGMDIGRCGSWGVRK